jgi:aminoglycoside phosphotransferase family enzyme/predicted kinase
MEPALPTRNENPLIDGLLRAEAYPHPTREIRLLETHISWVILTGDFAYKLKKPVRFNFVDYSTLELRKSCCEEELRLNRRLAPEIYLDVVPIAGPEHACHVSGDGPVCEYAVRMRQFSQDALLETAMTAGKTSLAHFDAFGRTLADFHQSESGAPVPVNLGTPEAIVKNVSDVWELLHSHAAVDMRESLHRLDAWRLAEQGRLADVFRERLRAGFVRECHGDLHLGNLLYLDGRVVAFDGIEFNPSLRWIDALSEVAFLVMDLDAAAHREAAFAFLNAYLEVTGDYSGLVVLPYYAAYRAAVRAAVTLLRASQVADGDAARTIRHEANRYLRAMERWTQPGHATLTITHGVAGSGKSTASRALMLREGWIRIRSDVERKRMQHASSATASAQEQYSPSAMELVYERLASLADQVLASGLSVIVDATFLRRTQRIQFRRIADQRKVDLQLVNCTASLEELRARIAARANDPDNVSDATTAIAEQQLASLDPIGQDETYATVIQVKPGTPPATRQRP